MHTDFEEEASDFQIFLQLIDDAYHGEIEDFLIMAGIDASRKLAKAVQDGVELSALHRAKEIMCDIEHIARLRGMVDDAVDS